MTVINLAKEITKRKERSRWQKCQLCVPPLMQIFHLSPIANISFAPKTKCCFVATHQYSQLSQRNSYPLKKIVSHIFPAHASYIFTQIPLKCIACMRNHLYRTKKITFNKVNLKSFFQMMRNEILQKSGWTPAPPEPICCGKNG